MTDLQSLLKKIDSLRDQLEKLKPLKKEDEERLWKKFRLEWNYNSNHIEGNTLTYRQTELLLIFEKTTGDHDMREYEEMKAHDVALKLITEYARDRSRELTESDIREINKIILVRPFWSNAQTSDGQPTRKLIQPGEYKKEPNSVLLQNGEMFHYASPEETPSKMKDLMDWYRKVTSDKNLHPVMIAAQLHYDFVRIHPFDDSNGRTSRLLMNYELMRKGYPPVIIKSNDKKAYLLALNKADVGDLNSFVEYIGGQLVWSFEVSLKAARSEIIEESDDIYKEIEVFKKKTQKELKGATPKSIEVIKTLIDMSLGRFFEILSQDQLRINDFYRENRVAVGFEGGSVQVSDKNHFLNVIHTKINEGHARLNSSQNKITIHFYRSDLKIGPSNYFSNKTIEILLDPFGYEVSCAGSGSFKKKYPQQLTEEEMEEFSRRTLKSSFDEIKLQNPQQG